MAEYADIEDQDVDADSKRLRDKFAEAQELFKADVIPQIEIRALALQARRFVDVPGAQWDGAWGDCFENSIKVEVPKVKRGIRKLENDYRQNRIVPDFRPAGGESSQETADSLDGIHRADSYHFKAQQARDNAYSEGIRGGFGAYRLANEYADPLDKDSDAQRVNPGMLIVDADQRVFFDSNAKTYDKSDAAHAWVLTAYSRHAFEKRWGADNATNFDNGLWSYPFDWYRPDMIVTAEFYQCEDVTQTLYTYSRVLTGEQERYWADEIDSDEREEYKSTGWTEKTQRRKRRRVHKYVMNGARILEDQGFIVGSCIPVVPFYGERNYVDNVERFQGYTQSRMDVQRMYNAKVSKLAETDALAPREIPLFAPSQMPPALADQWGRQNIERHSYGLVMPLVDPVSGQIISMGPIGKIEPPQVAPVTAALLQIANQDLTEDDQDGADEVKANTSADAMDIAATRVDAKSGVFLDNMRQTVQREGEIYMEMARECYFEPGRILETMDEDGGDGEATLLEEYTDDRGRFMIRNDFTRGRYKVIASVTEATATRRDKTVKASLNLADIAIRAQDQEMSQAAFITAVMNMDGEGMNDLRDMARKRGISIGLVKPNDEEAAAIEEAQQNQQPDPTAKVLEAQAVSLQASAIKDGELAKKAVADTAKAESDAIKIDADAELAQARTLEVLAKVGRPANDQQEERPRIRFGRDL